MKTTHTPRCAALSLTGLLLLAGQAPAALVHRWSFEGDTSDSVGGADATLVGAATVTGGQLDLPGGGVRTNYASAPGISSTLASNASITVEAWFSIDTLADWSKVWMFGTAAGGAEPDLAFIDFTPRTGLAGNFPKIDFDSTTGGELNTAGDPNPAALGSATGYYVASVYDAGSDVMSLYINGVLADSASMGGGNITQLGNTAENFFGAAVNFNDGDMDGQIDEMRIWNHALTPAEVALHNTLGAGVVPEPGTIALGLLAGAAGLFRRRRA